MWTPIALKINCGYARAAIRELTPKTKSQSVSDSDKATRSTTFQKFYSAFEIQPEFFVSDGSHNTTFDKNCESILNMFRKKWHPHTRRLDYETTFSVASWKSLAEEKKREHTLSNCVSCSKEFPELQMAFPGKPTYVAPTTSPVALPELQECSKKVERQEGRRILGELNQVWQERYDHTLTSAIPNIFPEGNLTAKKTKVEKKREGRNAKRMLVKHINSQLAENMTMTVLAEADSLASYNRKRHSMSFEKPDTPAKKVKSHSPSDENHKWSHDDAMILLQNVPPDQKINWSESARTLGIPGQNAGQVLKEFAIKHNVDVACLEHRSTPQTPRLRRRKKKLPQGEISTASLPSLSVIANERKQLVETGELSLGEPCTPYTITKYIVTTVGDVETQKIEISGRKIPLHELRSTFLKKQEKYMRLSSDEEIANLSKDQIVELMASIRHNMPHDATLEQLQTEVAKLQRTRTLAMWHDHSTILQTGYILFAIWVIYDPAMFLTAQEYAAKSGQSMQNLQEVIEQPVIYMIAPSSSSPADQLALVGDRLECLQDLSEGLVTTNGVTITDKLRFFCGDKPAQQFERGTQIGGTYKCGSCGCRDGKMQDLAHALQCKWRSLTDLQSLVLAGKYGNSPGRLKPFDNLKVNELRQELEARGCNTAGKLKQQMQAELDSILKGVQRVPTVLVSHPQQSLASLNLLQYEVLDCEPLHDLKGHIRNLLTEIPYLLPPPLKVECTKIIETTLGKQKGSGARLRVAIIKVFLKVLRHQDVDVMVKELLGTIVKISELLYANDTSRTSKAVLQLYNTTWLHHELCCHLISNPREQTLDHFYGVYLHDLVVHAPPQYQLVCLRSTNSESQERLFSQAKHISMRATNRKPENVLPTILLSMQAKQKMDTPQRDQESMVSAVASKVPKFKGTTIQKAFVASRLHSWQAHLQRISPFLQYGEGVWWKQGNAYQFLDADGDPDNKPEGPPPLHFRSTQLQDVQLQSEMAWNYILEKGVSLPTPFIRLFHTDGSYIGRRYYAPENQTGAPHSLLPEDPPHSSGYLPEDPPHPSGYLPEDPPHPSGYLPEDPPHPSGYLPEDPPHPSGYLPEDPPHPSAYLHEDPPHSSGYLPEDPPHSSGYLPEDPPHPSGYLPEDTPHPSGYLPEDPPHPSGYLPEDPPHPSGYLPEDPPHPSAYLHEDPPHSSGYLPEDPPHSSGYLPEDPPHPSGYLPEDPPHPSGYLPEDPPHSPGYFPEDPSGYLPEDPSGYLPKDPLHSSDYLPKDPPHSLLTEATPHPSGYLPDNPSHSLGYFYKDPQHSSGYLPEDSPSSPHPVERLSEETLHPSSNSFDVTPHSSGNSSKEHSASYPSGYSPKDHSFSLHIIEELPSVPASAPSQQRKGMQTPTANATPTQNIPHQGYQQSVPTPCTTLAITQLRPVELFAPPDVAEHPHTVSSDLEDEIVQDVTISCTSDYLQGETSLENTRTCLESKAATLICKAIGPSHSLSEFDQIRSQLKRSKSTHQRWTPTLTEQEQYRKLLAQLHTSLMSTKYSLKASIKSFEINFHKKHGRFPSQKQEDYTTLRKKLDYVKKLGCLWHTFEL